jgi:hypothetical protein
MISPEKYVEGVNSIYVEQPGYETGHDGSDGKCDCIGMCRGGSERAGEKDVKNMRGTNQAARKTIRNMQQLESSAQLMLGDVVLKIRDKDDKTMPLPERYRKGGADYDPRWGETNFTHIGTVTGVNPTEITHMTSPTAKKDKSIKGWSYLGELPWIEYESPPEPGPEPEYATVYAESGKPVKMRAKPSTSCRLYWEVPVGSVVIVDGKKDNWYKITWNDRGGWMMARFIRKDGGGGETTYSVTIPGLDLSQAKAIMNNYPGSIMKEERQ